MFLLYTWFQMLIYGMGKQKEGGDSEIRPKQRILDMHFLCLHVLYILTSVFIVYLCSNVNIQDEKT